ncbi:TniB family NTP-binding protein [Pseudomonas bohemica]|uniref:TniB family NTP-binding protein n=1 Tax=Pseudomonas bohemica TaxID=2044872 RepID=UPI000DA5F58B|nr:TniB family NTP-binding protein [Pseudomonas bohemica]
MIKGAYEHLSERARGIVELPVDERIQHVTKWMWVYSEAAAQIENIARRMMVDSNPSQAPCLLVLGPSGIGKTSLLNHLRRDLFFGKADAVFFDSRKCLTYKAFLLKFLATLNVGVAPLRKPTTAELEVELDTACQLRGVRYIVIDNVHDLMRGSRSDQRNILNFLREASCSDHPIVLICFAIEKFKNVLDFDPQLDGRFIRYMVPLWRDDDEFRSFLDSIESDLPLKMRSDLSGRTKVGWLLQHSHGVTKPIVEAIKHAAIAAMVDKKEKITLDCLKINGKAHFQQSNWASDD